MATSTRSGARTVCLIGFLFGASVFIAPAHSECSDQNTCYGLDALPANNGTANSAYGVRTLFNNLPGDNPWNGSFNTAIGAEALFSNSFGGNNTAVGYQALYSNSTSTDNSAVGYQAMFGNTIGILNAAFGTQALYSNTEGRSNSAFGFQALYDNLSAERNSAFGSRALFRNTTGGDNSAVGSFALQSNTTGNDNTAIGLGALGSNQTGSENLAIGRTALLLHAQGSRNSAVGTNALVNLVSGTRNIALGYGAGQALERGRDNILIGALNAGVESEIGVIRIGAATLQKKAYIAGISGIKTGQSSAQPVFIDANGQLGTIKSSREFKEDIRPMGNASERLLTLRPVTFRFSDADDDGSKPIQFGLIAEEVAEAFPELAIHDAAGKPETVRYDLVATLLLNEFQKARAVMENQAARIAALEAQAAEVGELRQQLLRMAEAIELLDHAMKVATTQ